MLELHSQIPSSSSAELFTPFPKKLWTYYDRGLKGYKWTTFCVNNMIHYARESGWEFNFLTDENYTKAFSTEAAARIGKIFKKFQTNLPFVQAKSDVLRAFLMLDQGGIWVDANTFFLGKLDWVNRLYEIPYIYNRFFPDPDVVTFSFNQEFGGNKTQVWDQDLKRSIYLFPGMEHWKFIAKPNSLFFQDVTKNLQRSIEIGEQNMSKEVKKDGVKFHSEHGGYYYYGSYQTQAVLQRQQYKMEANPSAYKTKYAVEYYKMWTFDEGYNGLMINQHVDGPMVHSLLFQFSREDMEDIFQAEVYPFSIKTIGWITGQVQSKINSFFNKTCSLNQNRVQPKSLFYQHIINISSQFPDIDILKKQFSLYQGRPNEDCRAFLLNVRSFGLLAGYIPTFLILILGYIVLYVLYNQRRSKLNYQEEISPEENATS